MEKEDAGPAGEDSLGESVKNLTGMVKRMYAVHRARWDCKNEPMEISLRRVGAVFAKNFGLTVRMLQALLPDYRVTYDVPDEWFNIQVILREDIKPHAKQQAVTEVSASPV